MADREEDRLFKEIDEELRQEQFTKLWQRYGNYVIGAAVLLVVAVAAFQGWTAYDQDRRAEKSALLATALRAVNGDKHAEASALLAKVAEGGSGGYAAIARLDEAGVKARSGKTAEAVADYLAISRDDSVPRELRDLALILSVVHDLDRGDAQELTQRLAPLNAGSGPWRHSAKELTALLAQRMGDRKRAGEMFREIADDATAPAGVRARAAEMSAVLGG